jgi:hypothetical protein
MQLRADYKDTAPLALWFWRMVFTLARIPALTRSRPLARPSRAFASGKFLSPFPKRLKSPPGRRRIVRRLFEMSCGGDGRSVVEQTEN